MAPRLRKLVALSFVTQIVGKHVLYLLSYVAAVVVDCGEHLLLKTSTQTWIAGVHR